MHSDASAADDLITIWQKEDLQEDHKQFFHLLQCFLLYFKFTSSFHVFPQAILTLSDADWFSVGKY